MSDQTREDIRRTWLVAEAAGRPEDGVRAHPIAELDAGTISVFLGADGTRHLIVPAIEGEVYPRLDGSFLTVRSTVLSFDDAEAPFLQVACSSPGLFDLFDELLVSVVETARGSDEPAADAARTVLRWRDLLRSTRPLSHVGEMGLFAELWVLNKATEGSLFDVGVWRGPLREPKDIVSAHAWAEVKAVAPDASSVRINGLDQLADVANLTGYLVCIEVREDTDGIPIASLIESLAARCEDAPLFDERLALYGWNRNAPSSRMWAAGDILLTPVEAAPRLTPADLVDQLHVGVTAVTYQVDLTLLRSMSVATPVTVISHLLQGGQL